MTSLSIQAVIFDMDGVFNRFRTLWQQVEYEVLSAIWRARDHRNDSTNHRFTHRPMRGLLVPQGSWPHYDNAKVSQAIVDKVASEILISGEVMLGVHEAIDHCQALGLKIGLATSLVLHTIIEAVLSVRTQR